MKNLIAAARADDLKGFGLHLDKYHFALFEMAKATDSFYIALDEKFGKVKEAYRPWLKEEFKRFKTPTFRLLDQTPKGTDKTVLTIWIIHKEPGKEDDIQEEKWIAVKEGKAWKINLPGKGILKEAIRKDADGKEEKVSVLTSREPSPKMIMEMEKRLKADTQALEKLTRQVRAGEFRTRDEAEKALRQAEEKSKR